MTVSAKPPIARYTGNGTDTVFAWDWDMIEDSSINVLLDNENVDNWTLQGETVVFDSAPYDGAEIIIYRRTVIRQPLNYRPQGKFPADKTEQSMDRAILIAQERAGDAGPGEPYNGIVGGANISLSRAEFNLTVVSERGTDAILPLWNGSDVEPIPPGPPDPSIIWAGSILSGGAYSQAENPNGIAVTLRFKMDLLDGDPAEASAYYENFNDLVYVGWCDVDPADGDYWIRFTENGIPLTAARYNISDGTAARAMGEAFRMNESPIQVGQGPYISVNTFGDVPPITRTLYVNVEICKDSSGLPDGNWASRSVVLEAIYNSTAPLPPDPPDPETPDLNGAVSWDSFFGKPFTSTISDSTVVIALQGVAIWFTVPVTADVVEVRFGSIELAGLDSQSRSGALNVTVGDFVSGATHVWGNGTGFIGWINNIGVGDIDLIPGNTYILNLRNDDPSSSSYPNWFRSQNIYSVQ